MVFKEWVASVEPLYPNEGEHVQSVRFDWRPVENASHYRIQASTEPNSWDDSYRFLDEKTNQTSFTPWKGKAIPANTTIYWRVQPLNYAADFKEITGTWSNQTPSLPACRSFVRDFLLAPYELPASGSTVNPPDLHWSSAMFADHYKITASGNGQSWFSETDNLSATPEETTTVKSGSTYQWWITPYDVDRVPGVTSLNPWSFTVRATPEDTATFKTRLIEPANGASFDIMPTFKWTPCIGAERYAIYYQRSGETVWYNMMDNLTKTTAYTSYTPKKILTAGSYTWFVQPTDKFGTPVGSFSDFGTFTVTHPQLVAMSEPKPGAVVNKTPTFTWKPTPKTAYYHIKVFADKDCTTLYDEAKTIFTSWMPTKSYADNSIGTGYYWYVHSVDGSDRYSPFILENARSFEKHSPYPQPVSPPESADVTNRPTLKWQPVEGAATYQVQVATDPNLGGSTIKINRNVDGPNLNIGSDKVFINRTLAEGTYYWRVWAIDKEGVKTPGGNDLAASPPQSFNVVVPKPVPTYPKDGATSNNSVYFTWQTVDSAKSYQVQVSDNAQFSGTLYGKPFTSTTDVYGNTYTPTTIYTPGQYYWRVRIKDPSGDYGPWSNTKTFTRTKATADLISPSNGATIAGDLVFKWQGTQNAATYKVVVSASPSFSSTYEQKQFNLTSWAPLMVSPNYSAGTYYWKVAPVDSANNEGKFSQPYSFVIGSAGTDPDTGGDGGGSGGGSTTYTVQTAHGVPGS